MANFNKLERQINNLSRKGAEPDALIELRNSLVSINEEVEDEYQKQIEKVLTFSGLISEIEEAPIGGE